MECPKCGEQLEDNVKTCPRCGHSFSSEKNVGKIAGIAAGSAVALGGSIAGIHALNNQGNTISAVNEDTTLLAENDNNQYMDLINEDTKINTNSFEQNLSDGLSEGKSVDTIKEEYINNELNTMFDGDQNKIDSVIEIYNDPEKQNEVINNIQNNTNVNDSVEIIDGKLVDNTKTNVKTNTVEETNNNVKTKDVVITNQTSNEIKNDTKSENIKTTIENKNDSLEIFDGEVVTNNEVETNDTVVTNTTTTESKNDSLEIVDGEVVNNQNTIVENDGVELVEEEEETTSDGTSTVTDDIVVENVGTYDSFVPDNVVSENTDITDGETVSEEEDIMSFLEALITSGNADVIIDLGDGTTMSIAELYEAMSALENISMFSLTEDMVDLSNVTQKVRCIKCGKFIDDYPCDSCNEEETSNYQMVYVDTDGNEYNSLEEYVGAHPESLKTDIYSETTTTENTNTGGYSSENTQVASLGSSSTQGSSSSSEVSAVNIDYLSLIIAMQTINGSKTYGKDQNGWDKISNSVENFKSSISEMRNSGSYPTKVSSSDISSSLTSTINNLFGTGGEGFIQKLEKQVNDLINNLNETDEAFAYLFSLTAYSNIGSFQDEFGSFEDMYGAAKEYKEQLNVYEEKGYKEKLEEYYRDYLTECGLSGETLDESLNNFNEAFNQMEEQADYFRETVKSYAAYEIAELLVSSAEIPNLTSEQQQLYDEVVGELSLATDTESLSEVEKAILSYNEYYLGWQEAIKEAEEAKEKADETQATYDEASKELDAANEDMDGFKSRWFGYRMFHQGEKQELQSAVDAASEKADIADTANNLAQIDYEEKAIQVCYRVPEQFWDEGYYTALSGHYENLYYYTNRQEEKVVKAIDAKIEDINKQIKDLEKERNRTIQEINNTGSNYDEVMAKVNVINEQINALKGDLGSTENITEEDWAAASSGRSSDGFSFYDNADYDMYSLSLLRTLAQSNANSSKQYYENFRILAGHYQETDFTIQKVEINLPDVDQYTVNYSSEGTSIPTVTESYTFYDKDGNKITDEDQIAIYIAAVSQGVIESDVDFSNIFKSRTVINENGAAVLINGQYYNNYNLQNYVDNFSHLENSSAAKNFGIDLKYFFPTDENGNLAMDSEMRSKFGIDENGKTTIPGGNFTAYVLNSLNSEYQSDREYSSVESLFEYYNDIGAQQYGLELAQIELDQLLADGAKSTVGDFFNVVGDSIVNGLDGWAMGYYYLGHADGRATSTDYKNEFYNQGLACLAGDMVASGALLEYFESKECLGDLIDEDGNLLTDSFHHYTDVYQIGTSIGNMLPSITAGVLLSVCTCGVGGAASAAVSVATKATLGIIRTAVTYATMGLSCTGNAIQEGLKLGMEREDATAYGVISGASEVFMEVALGSIPGITQLDELAKATGIKAVVARAINEGIEESVQEVFDTYLTSYFTNGKDLGSALTYTDVDWNQVWKAGFYGAVTSGVMSGCQGLVSGVKNVAKGITLKIQGESFNITSISELSALANKYKGQSLTDANVRGEFFSDLKALSALNEKMDVNAVGGLSEAEVTKYLSEYANIDESSYNAAVKGDLNTQVESFIKANEGSIYSKILGIKSVSDYENASALTKKVVDILSGMESMTYSEYALNEAIAKVKTESIMGTTTMELLSNRDTMIDEYNSLLTERAEFLTSHGLDEKGNPIDPDNFTQLTAEEELTKLQYDNKASELKSEIFNTGIDIYTSYQDSVNKLKDLTSKVESGEIELTEKVKGQLEDLAIQVQEYSNHISDYIAGNETALSSPLAALEYIKSTQSYITKLKTDLETKTSLLENLKNSETISEEVQTQIDTLTTEINDINSRISTGNNSVINYQKVVDSYIETRTDEINSQITSNENAISRIQSEIDKMNNRLDGLKKALDNQRSTITEKQLGLKQTEIDNLQASIDEKVKSIESLNETNATLTEKLSGFNQETLGVTLTEEQTQIKLAEEAKLAEEQRIAEEARIKAEEEIKNVENEVVIAEDSGDISIDDHQYSSYTTEQIMEVPNYKKLSDMLLSLAETEEDKAILTSILEDGGYEGYGLSTSLSNRDNPYIECERRVSLAQLFLTNRETFNYFVENNINLFHGTRSTAISSILENGLCSVDTLSNNGVDVNTGEAWSRIDGKRSFVSLTDVLDLAEGYSSINGTSTDFGVILSYEVNDEVTSKQIRISSDTPEIGIKDMLSTDGLKAICVPSDQVSYVQQLVGDSGIKVLALDYNESNLFYSFYDGYIELYTENFENFKNSLSNQSEVIAQNVPEIDIQSLTSYNEFLRSLDDSMLDSSKIATLLDGYFNNNLVSNDSKTYNKIVTSVSSKNGIVKSVASQQEEDAHVDFYNSKNYKEKFGSDLTLKMQGLYFEHIMTNNYARKVSVSDRLYLNLRNFSDIYTFAEEFSTMCEQEGLDYYFKLGHASNNPNDMQQFTMLRDESVVIYSSKEDLVKFAKITDQILQNHPEFVIDEPPVLTATINGKIGYGSEPNTHGYSFNSYREIIFSTALNSTISEYTSKFGSNIDYANISSNTEFIEIFKSKYNEIAVQYGLDSNNSAFNSNQYMPELTTEIKATLDSIYETMESKYPGHGLSALTQYAETLNSTKITRTNGARDAVIKIDPSVIKEYIGQRSLDIIQLSYDCSFDTTNNTVSFTYNGLGYRNISLSEALDINPSLGLDLINNLSSDVFYSVVDENTTAKILLKCCDSLTTEQMENLLEHISDETIINNGLQNELQILKAMDLEKVKKFISQFSAEQLSEILRDSSLGMDIRNLLDYGVSVENIESAIVQIYINDNNVDFIYELLNSAADSNFESLCYEIRNKIYYADPTKLRNFISNIYETCYIDGNINLIERLKNIYYNDIGYTLNNVLKTLEEKYPGTGLSRLAAYCDTLNPNYITDTNGARDAVLGINNVDIIRGYIAQKNFEFSKYKNLLNAIFTDVELNDEILNRVSSNLSLEVFEKYFKLEQILKEYTDLERFKTNYEVEKSAIERKLLDLGITDFKELAAEYGRVKEKILYLCYSKEIILDGNVTVRLYGSNVNLSTNLFNDFKNIYDKLPTYMRGLLKNVNIFNTERNPFDPYWAIEYNKSILNKFTSGATGGDGVINYWNSAYGSVDLETTFHEIGHSMDSSLGYLTKIDNNIWQDAINADNHKVSDYGATNATEDFAESVRRYYTDETRFRLECPNRFKVLSNIINNMSSS